MPIRNQRGAVLILALLIVALVAGLAVNYASQMQLHQARAINRTYGALQSDLADSLVTFAAAVADDDLSQGGAKNIDHRDEDWLLYPLSANFDELYFVANIDDAQALLNVNNLGNPMTDNKSATDPKRYTEEQRRFIRFLQTFDGSQANGSAKTTSAEPEQEPLVISQDQAIAITEAIVDWIDADDEPTGFNGAESLQYQQEGVTWVPPNAIIESLEELKLVKHVTPEIFDAIRPYLVALPAEVGLNINTVDEALGGRIFQSLNSEDSLIPHQAQDVQNFVSWMPSDGFQDTQDLIDQADFNALLTGGKMLTDGLGVSTEYYWLNLDITLDDKIVSRRILLFRDDQGSKVLAQYASGQATGMHRLAASAQADTGDQLGDSDSEDGERDGNRRQESDADGRPKNNTDKR